MYDQIDLDFQIVERPFAEKKRQLAFSGVKNLRELGGYRTTDGKTIRWGVLYRSAHLQKLTDADLKRLADLALDRIIDFRAVHEKEEEPDRLPADADIRIVELPILDSTTELWHDARDHFMKDDFRNVDSAKFMIRTNIELATRFTPQMSRFIHELLAAKGRPVLFHCAAGKDRTGYAAAMILRILGVPMETVMEDYLLSNQYYLSTHSWDLFVLRLMKGKRFSQALKGFLEVRPAYLSAAFETINREFGSFEKYVRNGLGLSEHDIQLLRGFYLE
jgi:protein-tyrosine phosphatase